MIVWRTPRRNQQPARRASTDNSRATPRRGRNCGTGTNVEKQMAPAVVQCWGGGLGYRMRGDADGALVEGRRGS
jgi:hypothetical protein